MAWGSLQHDAALHWSATALLVASVEVFVTLSVLLCAVLNFCINSFIRLSGFHIPCTCCTHLQKEPLENAVKTPLKDFVIPRSKPISAPIASEVGLSDIRDSDDFLRDADLNKSSDLSADSALSESTSDKPLLEVPPEDEQEGAASDETTVPPPEQVKEDSNDRIQEDANRENHAKDQEALQALQAEREAMAALYSELEEERNSSATAASEALAMISRLQEEKAAIQMESRQFQRMVMEKAMYDQEAIEVLKEILAKREEERLALEDEMQLYKEKLEALLMEDMDSAERDGGDHERAELVTTDRVISNSRLAKEEETEFLDRLNKTKSQLLTALLGKGIPEPASAFVESASFANEIHKAMSKIPLRAESLPILDQVNHKSSLGLDATSSGREIGLAIPSSMSHKKQTERASAKAKDTGITTDEPVLASHEMGPSTSLMTVEERNEEALLRDDGKVADEPVSGNRKSSLPTHFFAAVKKQTEKTLIKDDEKHDKKPEFVSLLSLKRRWSVRGSQELESLAKENRRIEEKRLSVLEYVKNLEEQLQQQRGRHAALHARSTSISGEENIRFKDTGQVESSSASVTSGSSEGLGRDDSLPRRLFVDGDSADKEFRTPFQGGKDHRIYSQQYSFNSESDGKGSNDDGELYANAERSEELTDEALFVHDVYEVQNHLHEAPSRFGLWVAGSRASLEIRSPISDRLGKPDNLDFEEENTRNKEEQDAQFLSDASAFPQADEDLGFVTQWRDMNRTQHETLRISTLRRNENSRSTVEEQVEKLTDRLKALEADRYLMKQTIDSLRRENGEMKLIQEIAQQLRELRGMEQKEMQSMDLPPSLHFQAGVAHVGPRTCKKRRYNSTPGASSCRPGTRTPGHSRGSSRSQLDLGVDGENNNLHCVV
ncbi:uncharacterized protein [Physcomitrium patens]|uniref:GTD-binding domain-containing protein n=1 Tax=Physcomitrium patens TaxID=3218 RepID=A0A2K1JZ65_PHYPA|nr:uncharacterized protein LOC112287855 [Physcomitrium patens]PNR46816.1 hypothetical protein PHYPA_013936 [Physcomitrium patens]|eukprot:XP_024387166.1 uncharacterized protein LOC112287855 [Physcomitrella patens]